MQEAKFTKNLAAGVERCIGMSLVDISTKAEYDPSLLKLVLGLALME